MTEIRAEPGVGSDRVSLAGRRVETRLGVTERVGDRREGTLRVGKEVGDRRNPTEGGTETRTGAPGVPKNLGRRVENKIADPRKRDASHWITTFPRFPKR